MYHGSLRSNESDRRELRAKAILMSRSSLMLILNCDVSGFCLEELRKRDLRKLLLRIGGHYRSIISGGHRFVRICQNYPVSLTNHRFQSEAMRHSSRADQFIADWLWWLKSGSSKGMGRSGFEPLKAYSQQIYRKLVNWLQQRNGLRFYLISVNKVSSI